MSNQMLCILLAQGTAKWREVKVLSRKKYMFWFWVPKDLLNKKGLIPSRQDICTQILTSSHLAGP